MPKGKGLFRKTEFVGKHLETNFGKRRTTRLCPWSLETTDRLVDWACWFSGLMPRKHHIGLMPLARIKTRIAGSAVGSSVALTGRKNVFQARGQLGLALRKARLLLESAGGHNTATSAGKGLGQDNVIGSRRDWRARTTPTEREKPTNHNHIAYPSGNVPTEKQRSKLLKKSKMKNN